MLSEMEAASNTMIVLMRSTGRYVHSRIHHAEGKKAYAEALKRCIALVRATPNDFDNYRFEISQRLHYEAAEHKKTFFNSKKAQREYATMAVHQALEIVDKLHGRFVIGMQDSEPRAYRGMGLLIYTDEGVFDEDISEST